MVLWEYEKEEKQWIIMKWESVSANTGGCRSLARKRPRSRRTCHRNIFQGWNAGRTILIQSCKNTEHIIWYFDRRRKPGVKRNLFQRDYVTAAWCLNQQRMREIMKRVIEFDEFRNMSVLSAEGLQAVLQSGDSGVWIFDLKAKQAKKDLLIHAESGICTVYGMTLW